MKITRRQLRRLIRESKYTYGLYGLSRPLNLPYMPLNPMGRNDHDFTPEEYSLHRLIESIDYLAKATPEDIDEGLTGDFMEMHVMDFKDLEAEGFIKNFKAYEGNIMNPETISLFFEYQPLYDSVREAYTKFLMLHPNIHPHPKVSYKYVQNSPTCTITYLPGNTATAIHISKHGYSEA